ncbi:hypothetical protein NM688_g1184 [Phlebia brevispora]|uniref:Uncharacterized protein n=1 Tax=Phlebia brevispora TaxID=194682 RepID=A0ACC1TBX8_9APHY|nr:hypothetical protein NM688_g1184 [Phlebia brevispora]
MSQGQAVTPFRVVTNSFEIRRLPIKPFYHYDAVIIKKDSRGDKPCPRQRCAQVIDRLQDSHPEIFNPRASYDGYRNMFSSHQFDDGQYTVQFGPRSVFEIKIMNVSTIHTADLMRFTTREGAADPLIAQNTIPVTLLQVIVSQGPHLAHNFSLHAKSFYEERNAFDLANKGIQGWRGYFQSVRPVLGRFIINVNTTAAAFYKPGKLTDVAPDAVNLRDRRTLIQRVNTDDRVFEELRRFYKGVVVSVEPNGLRKKITNIVRSAGRQVFDRDGAQITVECYVQRPVVVQEYWAEHHNIMLRWPDAFGVQVGYRDGIFPAEVCTVVAGQRYKKKLSPEDTAAFIDKTKTRPDQKMREIRQAVSGQVGPLNYAHSSWMLDAGIEVSTNPIHLEGHILPTPMVQYGSGPLKVGGGAWNVMRQRLVNPARVDRWGVVLFDDSPGIKDRANEFLQMLVRNMSQLGIQFTSPPVKESGEPADAWSSLKRTWHKAVSDLPPMRNPDGSLRADADGDPLMPRPSFILVVLPANAAELRKQVKQWGDVKFGIVTQCVRGGKYDKPNGRDQYCNNVALKINAKLGGVNNHARPGTATANLMKEAMFVGDLVASMDPNATKYHVYVAAQPPRQEIITDMARMLRDAIRDYGNLRQALPAAIVIYRDGVSEGEYAKVEQEEIRSIEATIKDVSREYKELHNYTRPIHLVFIVVGKRHHNRFFPEDKSQGDRSGNCPPGLVVDQGIVHSKYIDFYLLSHTAIVGTSRPSHYVVLRNTPNVGADRLHELSYALCHVYASATRAVSIPAPVYYADRVCARVADFQFHPSLYEDDHSTDGGTDTPFPLEKWKQGLGLSRLTQQMYFL